MVNGSSEDKVTALWEKAQQVGITRRKFLALLGAGGATAVLLACGQPAATTSPKPATTSPKPATTSSKPATSSAAPPPPPASSGAPPPPPPGGAAPPAAGGGVSGTIPKPSPASGKMVLTSSVVKEGGSIPDQYSRVGSKAGLTVVSPPLVWTGAPAGTKSFAVIGYSEIPHGDGTSIFWILLNIPGAATSVAEGVKAVGKELQAFITPQESGPGEYIKHITVYALSTDATVPATVNGDAVAAALKSITLDTATLNYKVVLV